jgi:hypothetical protein
MEKHRARARLCLEEEEEADAWGRRVSDWERRLRTSSDLGDAGPRPKQSLGRNGSLQPFSPFLYYFSFLFLNSDLIQILCKFGSKPFKQIPKFFKSSKQCFKPVINQVSKTKDNL